VATHRSSAHSRSTCNACNRHGWWRVARRTVIGIAVVAQVSCSFWNPLVSVDDKWPNPNSGTDLSSAIAVANKWRDKYYDAAGDDNRLRAGLAIAMVPAAAVGIYLGATGSHKNAIAGLGLGSAAAFGLGSYFQSTPRQRIYLAGSTAIGCAIQAVQPFAISKADADGLARDLTALGNAIDHETSAIDAANSAYEQLGRPPRSAMDTDTLAQAATLLTNAKTAFATGQSLKHNISAAAGNLQLAVYNIRDQVGQQLISTEPDLAALTGIISGLGKSAAQFQSTAMAGIPVTPPLTAPQSNDPALTQYIAAMNSLSQASVVLAQATNAINSRVSEFAAGRAAADPLACKVADTQSHITVSPAGSTQTLAAGGSLQFTVTGGSGIPRAALSGNVIAGVKLDTSLQSGMFVATVSAGATTPGGDEDVVFSDGANSSQSTVHLKISKGSATNDLAAVTAPVKDPTLTGCMGSPQSVTPSAFETSGIVDWKTVQTALNTSGASKAAIGKLLTIDGKPGPDTRVAIGQSQKMRSETVTCTLTQADYLALTQAKPVTISPPPEPQHAIPTQKPSPAEVKKPAAPTVPEKPVASAAAGGRPAPSANAACPSTQPSEIESKLTSSNIKAIQQALGMPAMARSGILDDKTREAIQGAWPSFPTLTPPSNRCSLTAPLKDALLGQPAAQGGGA
jgi:hypothetical protein